MRLARGSVSAVLAATVLAGCGGDEQDKSQPAEATASRTVPAAPAPAPSPSSAAPAPAAAPSASPPPGGGTAKPGTAVTTPSGAVVVPPKPPRQTSTAPSESCTTRTFSDQGRSKKTSVPPQPGVRARRLSAGVIRVDYRLPRSNRRCPVAFLEVSIDLSTDTLPATTSRYRVKPAARAGVIRVRVPADLAGADVVRVSAVSPDGRTSDAAAVTAT